MQEEREISLVGAMYTMAKRWKIMLLVAILVFATGYGFFLYRAKKAASAGPASVATAANAAETVKAEEAEAFRKKLTDYKEYLENSEYMKVDPNALRNHVLYYVIKWDETGLLGSDSENKSATLYGLMASSFSGGQSQLSQSSQLGRAIFALNEEYAKRSLDELVTISRSGNTITFTIAYSDDSYVKDLEAAIDAELKSKADKYSELVGKYELVLAQEIDIAVDGTLLRNAQTAKKTGLTNLEKELTELATKASAYSASAASSGFFIGKKNTLICLLMGIFCGLAVGFVMAVFGKRFESATDVSDLTGQEVVCAFKKDPESGLDRLYYKRNDRYRNPERYLAILEKTVSDAGVKKLYLYNCSGRDLSNASEKICSCVKNIGVMNVADADRESFYLGVAEDEAVLIMVKGGDTSRRDFVEIMEHLKAVNAKCAGVVFVA